MVCPIPRSARRSARKGREAKGETLRAYDRKWRKANPEKEQARRDADYFRPFVPIDSEGRNYPGVDDIFFDEAKRSIIPVSKLRGATARNYTNAENGAGEWLKGRSNGSRDQDENAAH
jgi:hypothetical protein